MASSATAADARVPWLLLGPAIAAVIIFTLGPILFIGAYSVMTRLPSGVVTGELTLDSWRYLFSDLFYVQVLAKTVWMAFVATLLCALIGYAPACFLVRQRPSIRNFLLLLIFLPSWISYVIRTMAWYPILSREGLVNKGLEDLGLISAPLQLLYNDYSVYIGVIQYVLPFMIINIYVGLQSVDQNLVSAARTLGASAPKAFMTVTFPLAFPGLAAGSLLCFILAMGTYVTPMLLGGTSTTYYAKLIYDSIIVQNDWPVGAAVSIVLIAFLAAVVAVYAGKFSLSHVLKGGR